MSLWRQLRSGWRVLTNRAARDREITDEVEHFYEQQSAELVRRGLTADEARRATQRQFGDTLYVREQVRSYGWENIAENLFADLRQGVRRLIADPAFACASLLTLALGIGASTAIFSVINPVMLEPLPYPQPKQLVMLWDRTQDGSRLEVTFGTFRELVQRSRSFADLAVARSWQPTLASKGEPERLEGQSVSAGFFRVLGMQPMLGRDFTARDDEQGAPGVALISYDFWQRRFGGDRAIVGQTVRLDDQPLTIIGVLPQSFENVLAPRAAVWRALQYDPTLASFETREWGHHLRMIGRLRPGVRLAQARSEIDGIARRPVPELARPRWAALAQSLSVITLQSDIAGDVRPTLLAVLGAVALLLAIACVNVTSLLLARGARRRAEFAMRVTLGAGRTRLLQQLLTESLLVAVLGGALGIGVAALGIRGLVGLSPAALPRLAAIQLDMETLGFALALTTTVGLLIGLVPALHAARSLHAGLQLGSRRTTAGRARARTTLVVTEVALALVMLSGAGLLVRSLAKLFAIQPGFAPEHVLTLQVQAGGAALSDEAAMQRRFNDVLEAVRRVPGVKDAGFTSQLPFTGDYSIYGIRFEDRPTEASDAGGALRYTATPGYIETLGIPLLRGRTLDARDVANAPPAVVINESLAKRIFPGQDPLGKRVHVGDVNQPWFTIVGVVGDVKQGSLADTQFDAAYMTPAQWYFTDNALWLAVKTTGNAATFTSAVKTAVWSVAPDFPIVRVATIERLVATSAGARRFALTVFAAFALVALILAATGIYGILAGSVTERTREIGVRSALGASRGDVVALVLKQGMGMTAVGIALGLAGALAANRTLMTLLYNTSPLDISTHAAAIALLFLVAAGSCLVPAWRAARIDPAITLRSE